MSKSLFLQYIPTLYLNILINFAIVSLLVELALFVFRVRSAHLKHLYRLIPYLKVVLLLCVYKFSNWTAFHGLSFYDLEEGSRVLTAALRADYGLPRGALTLISDHGQGYFFTIYDLIAPLLSSKWLKTIPFTLLLLSAIRAAHFFIKLQRERDFIHSVRQNPSSCLFKKIQIDWFNRTISIYSTNSTKVPFSYGVIHPEIYLPKSLKEEITEEELESVLQHEMAHIVRLDGLTNPVIKFLSACFFLPTKKLDLTMEKACDEWAIKRGSKKRSLALAIKKASCLPKAPFGITLNSFRGKGAILERANHIANFKPSKFNRWILLAVYTPLAYFFLLIWRSQIGTF